MKLTGQVLYFVVAAAVFASTGCATIVNDPNIPLTVSFSDGSAGQCTFKNKRGSWSSEIPTTNLMIRRSDDALIYDCSTDSGIEITGSIQSEMEGGKMAASVMFWDFGITDAITDKHRTYQGNVVIPVLLKPGARQDNASSSADNDESVSDPFDDSLGEDEIDESSQAKSSEADPLMTKK